MNTVIKISLETFELRFCRANTSNFVYFCCTGIRIFVLGVLKWMAVAGVQIYVRGMGQELVSKVV